MDPYPIKALSPRERAVASLLVAGLTQVEIVGRLGLTPATVAAIVEWITPPTGEVSAGTTPQ